MTFTVSAIGVNPASLRLHLYRWQQHFSQHPSPYPQRRNHAVHRHPATTSGGSWFTLLNNTCNSPAPLPYCLARLSFSRLAANTLQRYGHHHAGGVHGSPAVVVPITLTVLPTPPVTVNPTSLVLIWQTGVGAANPSTTFAISTTAVAAPAPWLQLHADRRFDQHLDHQPKQRYLRCRFGCGSDCVFRDDRLGTRRRDLQRQHHSAHPGRQSAPKQHSGRPDRHCRSIADRAQRDPRIPLTSWVPPPRPSQSVAISATGGERCSCAVKPERQPVLAVRARRRQHRCHAAPVSVNPTSDSRLKPIPPP